MQVVKTAIPEVLLLEPKVFGDTRGFFFEAYNKRSFQNATGVEAEFVQDNHSRSGRNVLRGLHYQVMQAQGKLVRVIAGEIWDVAVDLRHSSPTFGKWAGFALDAESKCMAWIPPGFAHGFVVVSEFAEVLYKATDYYAPEHERCLLWNDPALGIRWPLKGEPVLAERDKSGRLFANCEVYP